MGGSDQVAGEGHNATDCLRLSPAARAEQSKKLSAGIDTTSLFSVPKTDRIMNFQRAGRSLSIQAFTRI
jgi:hypothetical protein